MNLRYRLFVLCGLLTVPAYAADFFVDQAAPPGRPGISWSLAYRSLAQALANPSLSSGDRIFMAQGTYLATHSFSIPNGVTLRGGFAKGGHIHDPVRYETILSNNTSAPIVSIPPEAFPILRDLTVADGQAIGIHIDANAAPLLQNLLVTRNRMGIFVKEGGDAMPTFENVTFYQNASTTDGAGLYLDHRSATINGCRFIANQALGRGGAVYHEASNSTYTNCLFHHNTTAGGAGGAVVDDAETRNTYLNCTFAANAAAVLGAALFSPGNRTTTLINSIISGFQDVQISTPNLHPASRNNFLSGQDPQFRNPNGYDQIPGTLDDDFRLSPDSPVIEKGSNVSFPSPSFAVDLAGNKRLLDGDRLLGATIDMGAYEFMPVLYVNSALSIPTGLQNGFTWDKAFTRLQDAIQEADPHTQIWVASGTYFPDRGRIFALGDRDATFTLKNQVELYGGFPVSSGLNTFAERDPENFPSILSGDLQEDDDPDSEFSTADNSYNIARGTNLDATTCLDGFTIQAGQANGSGIILQRGAGLDLSNSSLSIINCTFRRNAANATGGGLFATGGVPRIYDCRFEKNSAFTGGGVNLDASSPDIRRCHFLDNTAVRQGAGLFAKNASSVGIQACTFTGNSTEFAAGACYISSANLATFFTNCLFTGNSTTGDGGAVSVLTEITLTNCAFAGNFAVQRGGGISLRSTAHLINCSFQGNAAEIEGGGAITCYDGSPRLTNCIAWNNLALTSTATPSATLLNTSVTDLLYTHCLLENLNPPGTGNLSGTDPSNNPSFIVTVPPALEATTGSNLRLRHNSAVRNFGDSTVMVPPLDLAANPRISEHQIDLGAYEHQPTFNTLYPTLGQDGDENANGLSNFVEYAAGFDPTVSNNSITNPYFGPGLILTFTLRTDNPAVSAQLESSTILAPPFTILSEGRDYLFLNRIPLTSEREQHTYLIIPNTDTTRNFFRVNYRGSFINPD